GRRDQDRRADHPHDGARGHQQGLRPHARGREHTVDHPLLAGALAALLAAAGLPASGQEAEAPAACAAEAPCPVPLPVYIGWRVYNVHCAVCHAEDAVGSTFAPALTQRIASMDRRAFVSALDRGYLGPRDATPPRGADPEVARYYEEL